DLVGRKLGLDGGLAFDGLIADIEAEAQHPTLIALTDMVEVAAATLRAASPEDRLAGSYPFLTMCSVMVAGWLVERLARAPDATDRDRAAAEFFLAVVVPEALGLAAGAECGSAMLFAVPAESLA
ncbi:MAG: acyl-CoA dehydrogenase C-terminal domain-containing protein, partial [Sphingomicrobium sp.]